MPILIITLLSGKMMGWSHWQGFFCHSLKKNKPNLHCHPFLTGAYITMRRISSIALWQKAIIPRVFSCRFPKWQRPVLKKTGEPLETRLRLQYLENNCYKIFWPSQRLGRSGAEPFACDDDLKGWHDEWINGGYWETWLAVSNEIMTCKHPCSLPRRRF